MQKLLLAATKFEIESYISHFLFEELSTSLFQKNDTYVLISGIGMTATTYNLTRFLLEKEVGLVVQAGIAGVYEKKFNLGDLVEVTSEQIGDLGAESANEFLTLEEMGLSNEWQSIENLAYFKNLPIVKGISVNTVAGSINSINNRINKFDPDIETMEGYALFKVCKSLKTNCAQVRAISNPVEVRNKANWKIQLAIKNLNQFLIRQFKP